MNTTIHLNQKYIFRFWSPLAATWLMMAVEGPLIAAIIARLNDATENLAAYGVAFAIGLIIEAPIIMIMSASTALVKDKISFIKLKRFTYGLNFGITAIMLVLLIPTIFSFVTSEILMLPPKIAELTYGATLLLLPWPAAIGYRRFYQGLLIRFNLTRRVAYGTIIRLTSMTAVVFSGFYLKAIPGAYIGAAALSVAVIMEAIASKIMAAHIVRELNKTEVSDKILTYGEIKKFYTPLAMTSLISLGIHPIVTFFVSGSVMAIESLAVLPVINSFIFIFRSLGLSFQEAAIALLGDDFSGFKALNKFFTILGSIILISLLSISFSPLLELWYKYAAGLDSTLLPLTKIPTQILAIIPFLSLLLSYQRAILVKGNDPGPVSTATVIEVTGIFVVLWVTLTNYSWVGVYGAALAFLIGRIGANVFLVKKCLIVINRVKTRP